MPYKQVEGYSLMMRKKVMFTPTEMKKLPNGTISLIGEGPNGERVARIVKASDLPKYKK